MADADPADRKRRAIRILRQLADRLTAKATDEQKELIRQAVTHLDHAEAFVNTNFSEDAAARTVVTQQIDIANHLLAIIDRELGRDNP